MILRNHAKLPVCLNRLFFRLFHDLLHRVALDVESLCGIAYGLIDPVIDLAELLEILISEIQLPDVSAASRHIVETVRMAQTARNALGGERKRQTRHADLLQITFHPRRERKSQYGAATTIRSAAANCFA